MEYAAFAFAVFGLMAYLQVSSLKNRVTVLEEQLAGMKGTALHEERAGLQRAARALLGQSVELELKEDQEDTDIVMYGNTKHGSNTILDVDEEWMLIHVCTPRGEKDKLIRLGSVQSIRAAEPQDSGSKEQND